MARKYRSIPSEEQETVGRIMHDFSERQVKRNMHAGQWEETARLIWPEHRNTFYYGNWNFPGLKKTQQQVDATGMLALHRFAAIADSLLTPANSKWHALQASNDYIMKNRQVRLWFDTATTLLFKYRKNPLANFRGQNNSNLRALGGFGNATMFVDAFDGRDHHGFRGLRYKSVPLGETFFRENHQGIVDSMIRWFRYDARQAKQKFGEDKLPMQIIAALEKDSSQPFDFLHCVEPRRDYERDRFDAKGMPYASYYVSIQGGCLMPHADGQMEGGYRRFPYAVSRYDQAPMEWYGRGPAQMVLPALKTLNAQKSVFLKQGHRAADPVLLTADDGIIDMNMKPGAINAGGVSPDGKELVKILPSGEIQIVKEMMAEERSIIDDMFLVTLYKVLSEHPNMTATQVIELVNEKGILVAPTLGRQETEYLGPMIERELDILNALGLLPPMPPLLKEAQGEYEVVYTSPLAMAQRAQEAAGFIRTVETAKEIVNITQDPSYLDPFDFDAALPEIAAIQSVPERWMAPPEKIAQKRQNRAKAQAQQAQMQALPAQAAMLKAQAAVAKAQPGLGTQGIGGPAQ
ncbi:portal protein [Bradyrhizobium sp. SZCCHNRI1073]|uniref:portal protein n=1 Tax=Bradyrhizobium sp. SZCCHNRI1073 TaxID=3057280 RepID=UPI0029169614|nr:portal protein [Bradyrhizobium sp. SZCCHNRI1073]